MAVPVDRTVDVGLTDLDMWARGVPYDQFARLRDQTPVAWSDEPGGPGFWSVLRYNDIVTASRDVRTFSSSRGISFEDPTDEDMAARRTIIDTDPPAHTKLRKILSGSFTQRAVAVYRHFVQATSSTRSRRRSRSGCWRGSWDCRRTACRSSSTSATG
jgi:cytochrome P450